MKTIEFTPENSTDKTFLVLDKISLVDLRDDSIFISMLGNKVYVIKRDTHKEAEIIYSEIQSFINTY